VPPICGFSPPGCPVAYGDDRIKRERPILLLLSIWYYQSRSSVKRFLGRRLARKSAIQRDFSSFGVHI